MLPDACVDVVAIGERVVVAGPATGPAVSELAAGTAVVGVRFRVGAAGAALGLPARELLDRTVPLDDVWGRESARLAEAVAAAQTTSARLGALAAGVRARIGAAEPDPLVRAVAVGQSGAVAAARGPRPGDPGVGERQLRRRFADAVGYGPATLRRVLRFQRFLALAAGARDPDLARLAAEAGYADQPHLTRECRRLAGLTPAALLAAGAEPAGEASVPFKTDRPGAATIAA